MLEVQLPFPSGHRPPDHQQPLTLLHPQERHDWFSGLDKRFQEDRSAYPESMRLPPPSGYWNSPSTNTRGQGSTGSALWELSDLATNSGGEPASGMSRSYKDVSLHTPASQHANNAHNSAMSIPINYNDYHLPVPQQVQSQHQSTSRSMSRPESHAPSPTFQQNPSSTGKGSHSSSKSGGAIHQCLQLPSTISPNPEKSSLAEFAAQVTCLFWFEVSTTLSQIQERRYPTIPPTSLAQEAIPSTGFLKWVTTILSTTQVAQNVTLLALMFIRRLKNQNPYVKGKPGSEYRLFTVALMLGNKFLDDNTYTNKTWAEVSGISVTEIHVMEVEFLSHMKYDLYTSKEQWDTWHEQLQHLWKYFNVPFQPVQPASSRPSSLRPPNLQIPPSLPSPPTSNNASPPYSRSSPTPYALPPTIPGHLAPPQISPTSASSSDVDMTHYPRKRSWDESAQEYPSKRSFGYDPQHAPKGPPPSIPNHSQGYVPKLPSIPTANLPPPVNYMAQNPHQSHNATLVSGRTPQNSLPPFGWSNPSSTSQSSLALPHPHLRPTADASYDRGSRRQSPLTQTPTNISPKNTTHGYPSLASHSTTQNQSSPSYFLKQRTSPYRPVRNMSTLTVAPPSGQIQNQPSHISNDQMHWQPLGKAHNERRTGPVPYLHREAWPSTHQADHWPSYHHPQYPTGTY
ncbi:MAG: hypothetical protein M1831_007561 [Alyxoria varia]|nr:MAG: hypothetical protein M1831_007561 [Alyxoria varia]